MRLSGSIVAVPELQPGTVQAMWELYSGHFEGSDQTSFREDLAEKQRVILLAAPDGSLAGFSTLGPLEGVVDDTPVRALYSGDTIVSRGSWGDVELARVWGRAALEALAGAGERPLFWVLISQGIRTYHFLPLYFAEYLPRHDRPDGVFERRVLDTLLGARFPTRYDAAAGVVRAAPGSGRLRPELAEIAAGRLAEAHVRFFLERNPSWREGDELACLARIAPTNLTTAGRRVIGWGGRGE